MGCEDIQHNAAIIHEAALPNDPTIGILGIGHDGRPSGVVFVDPGLSLLYSEKTERTIVTFKKKEG